MDKIIVYSTGCPKCRVLKAKLDQKGIPYEECSDMSEITKRGFAYLPVMEKDGEFYDFAAAVKIINEEG